ncbi:MAG: sigma-54 dependent transcriptional regulator [Pseudomonadota bacterium]
MPLARVLVVDDEPTYRTSVSRCLTNQSYRVTAAESAEKALSLLTTSRFDLVITDLKMGGMSGIDLLKKMHEVAPNTASIIMTAFGTIDTAIEATKLGAFHYLIKPFNIDDVIHLSKKAIEHKKLRDENVYLKRQYSKTVTTDNIIGKSHAIKTVIEITKKVCVTDSSVLITGEVGTGKELVAKTIHFTGRNSKGLFVNVDCSSGSTEQIESELFGYVKGAFPGAISNREGKLEVADGGTLFLENISEMPSSTQSKLLKFMTDGTFSPLGVNKNIESDVRVISSSTKNIEQLVNAGRFKKELLYTLNVVPINIPALRERKEDIPLFINHFINTMSGRKGKRIDGVDDDAMNALVNYSWPGNVAEVRNLIERLVVLSTGEIKLSDIPEEFLSPAKHEKQGENYDTVSVNSYPKVLMPEDGVDLNVVIRGLEDDLIMQALTKTNWNKNQAAKLLKLNRTTLVEKLRKRGAINRKALVI